MSDIQQAMTACSTCPKMCRHVCPTGMISHRESRTPTAKSTLGLLWDKGVLPLDDDMRQAFYDCCHCGACADVCEVDGVDLIAETRYLRAQLVSKGEALPAVVAWSEALPPVGQIPEALAAVFRQYARPDASARTLFLLGAATAGQAPAVIQAALALADARGETVATLGGDESATGGEALDLGFPELARQQAQALADKLNAGAWERIVTLDPTDAVALTCDWPTLNVTVRPAVLSFPAWLQEGTFVPAVTERVTYHDPCSLARGLGDVDGPRALIRAMGADLVEPLYAGRETRCCGGDGGLAISNPSLANALAAERAQELQALGVERILTACATCATRLGTAVGPSIPVEDLGHWLWRKTPCISGGA